MKFLANADRIYKFFGNGPILHFFSSDDPREKFFRRALMKFK